ncbi:MAG TPA: hypothetical protein VF377_10460 [Acidimicrobiia bacterium]
MVDGEIAALTEKTTPHDDDVVVVEDSEASYAKKKVKLSNLGGGADTLDDLTDVDTSGVQDGDALVYDGDTNTWGPGEVASGSEPAYSEIVGDTSETTFNIAHGLDTSAVVVEVIEVTSGDALVAGTDYTWSVTDADTIQVVFASAPGADDALVVVLASGGTSSGGGGGGPSVFWAPASAGSIDDDYTSDTSADYSTVTTTGTVAWALRHRSGLGALNRGPLVTCRSMTAGDLTAYVKSLGGAWGNGAYVQAAVRNARVYGGGTTGWFGIILTDGTADTSNLVALGVASNNNATNTIDRFVGTITNASAVNLALTNDALGYGPLHLRITQTAANTWTFAFSLNGDDWSTLASGVATTLTPTHVGFFAQQQGSIDTQGQALYLHSSV